jgi:hypothetical protein
MFNEINDEQADTKSPIHPTAHFAISIINVVLSVFTLIFWLGVDHQRITALEAYRDANVTTMRELEGTNARLKSLEETNTHLTNLIDEILVENRQTRNRLLEER